MNLYGFYRIRGRDLGPAGVELIKSNCHVYVHPKFQRGYMDLCGGIRRVDYRSRKTPKQDERLVCDQENSSAEQQNSDSDSFDEGNMCSALLSMKSKGVEDLFSPAPAVFATNTIMPTMTPAIPTQLEEWETLWKQGKRYSHVMILPEDEKHRSVRVGSDYQAEIPPLIQPQDRKIQEQSPPLVSYVRNHTVEQFSRWRDILLAHKLLRIRPGDFVFAYIPPLKCHLFVVVLSISSKASFYASIIEHVYTTQLVVFDGIQLWNIPLGRCRVSPQEEDYLEPTIVHTEVMDPTPSAVQLPSISTLKTAAPTLPPSTGTAGTNPLAVTRPTWLSFMSGPVCKVSWISVIEGLSR